MQCVADLSLICNWANTVVYISALARHSQNKKEAPKSLMVNLSSVEDSFAVVGTSLSMCWEESRNRYSDFNKLGTAFLRYTYGKFEKERKSYCSSERLITNPMVYL